MIAINRKSCSNLGGFTLIELGIVLILIGLITAGIIGGASMIRQAKLRAIVADVERYKIAYNNFKEEYAGIPGDLSTAYNFWGSSCDATPSNCNGDGNGVMTYVVNNRFDNEIYRFWQHLELAGYVKGNFSGIGEVVEDSPAFPYFFAAGKNAPVINGYKNITFGAISAAHGYGSDFKNKLLLGHEYGDSGGNGSGFMIPKDARYIDIKSDDGVANKGVVRGSSGDDSSTLICNAAEYDVQSDDPDCVMLFQLD